MNVNHVTARHPRFTFFLARVFLATMKKITSPTFTLLLVCALIAARCGGGGTAASYTDTVTAYASNVSANYTSAKSLADAYNTFIALDLTSASPDTDDIDAKLTAFTQDLDSYNTNLQTIGANAHTTYPSKRVRFSAAKDAGSIGIDAGKSLNSLNTTLQEKKAACDVLKAKISTNLNDLTAFAQAKSDYEQCTRELAQLAASEGFKIVVVESGGSAVGGATAGGIFLYVAGTGATLISGPGILVVAVGALIGSKVADVVYDYCTSSSDKDVTVTPKTSGGGRGAKSVSAGNYCAVAAGHGLTGTSIPINTTGGTGSLHISIDGYAPIELSGITVNPGETLTVSVSPVALTSVTDDSGSTIDTASNSSTTASATSPATTCASTVGVSASNSPASPGVGQTVTVTATVNPIVTGCTMNYSVAGTDGYAASGSPTTSSAGQISFTIPGGAADVHDVVTITESASSAHTTVAYTFE